MKPRLSAKRFLASIHYGMTYEALMLRYGLSEEQLDAALNELVQEKLLSPLALPQRVTPHYLPPDAPTGAGLIDTARLVADISNGASAIRLMVDHDLTVGQLDDLLRHCLQFHEITDDQVRTVLDGKSICTQCGEQYDRQCPSCSLPSHEPIQPGTEMTTTPTPSPAAIKPAGPVDSTIQTTKRDWKPSRPHFRRPFMIAAVAFVALLIVGIAIPYVVYEKQVSGFAPMRASIVKAKKKISTGLTVTEHRDMHNDFLETLAVLEDRLGEDHPVVSHLNKAERELALAEVYWSALSQYDMSVESFKATSRMKSVLTDHYVERRSHWRRVRATYDELKRQRGRWARYYVDNRRSECWQNFHLYTDYALDRMQ